MKLIVLRALLLIGVVAGAVVLSACFHASPVKIEEACQPRTFGEGSVEFAAADTREPTRETGMNRLVVQIRDGTAERAPIADAQILLRVGTGADSGRFILGRTTPRSGIVTIDSLAARHYEVMVRRIGFETARQAVAVRQGFTDTLRLALRGVVVCLVE